MHPATTVIAAQRDSSLRTVSASGSKLGGRRARRAQSSQTLAPGTGTTAGPPKHRQRRTPTRLLPRFGR